MVSDGEIVAKVVRETLEELEKRAPKEFAKLIADPKKKHAIKEVAREAAKEQINLSKVLAGQPEDINKALLKHLPQERVDMILGGLSIPTFKMEISKRSDGKYWVECTKGGVSFEAARALTGSASIDRAKILQYGSIVVEAVMLVMSVVGLSVFNENTDEAVEEAVTAIRSSSKFRKAIEKFVDAWVRAGGSRWAKARALFNLIKETSAVGILWNIIKLLCKNLSWQDRLLTAAKVSAMIIAALATEGTALIAEIALIVLSAVEFATKITNVIELNNLS